MASRGSGYTTDLVLAFVCRGILFSGLCILAFAVTGCASYWDSGGGTKVPPLDIRSIPSISDGDRGAGTRNNLPTKDGGDYEKSDCAPPRPAG